MVSTASLRGRSDWGLGFQINKVCKLRLCWVLSLLRSPREGAEEPLLQVWAARALPLSESVPCALNLHIF